MLRLTALAVIVMGFAACRSADAEVSDEQVVASCLEEAGIGGDLGEVDLRRQQDAAFDADLVRCYAAIGVELPPPGELTRVWDEILLQEVRCLRDKGWDVPEPQRHVEGGALNLGNTDDFVPEDQYAAFEADDEACLEEIVPPGQRFDLGDDFGN